jgi:hypothetical protein
MDYEVFLLSRIKECYDECGDSDAAVANGLQRSGRIITSAALLVIIVYLDFAAGETLGIKEMGLALAIAVAIDATLVRCLLVPATMTPLGNANWWTPEPLRRLYARFGLREAPTARTPTPLPAITTTHRAGPGGLPQRSPDRARSPCPGTRWVDPGRHPHLDRARCRPAHRLCRRRGPRRPDRDDAPRCRLTNPRPQKDPKMPTAQAGIDTDRADRYLAQLCNHLGNMRGGSITGHLHPGSRHQQPAVQRVERTGRRGELVFDWGTCTLMALDDALIVTAQAADPDALERAQAMIGHRIETIGHREDLTVTWRRTDPAGI